MRKFILLFLLIIILTFLLGDFCLAAERSLEIEYPPIGGYTIERTTTSLPQYIKYFYYFFLGISGLVALGALIWAGFRYLISTGRPEVMKDAKDQITAVLLGMLILFCSWLIINTINPELTILKIKPLIPFVSDLPRGVLLCEKQVDISRGWSLLNEFEELEALERDLPRRREIKVEFREILTSIVENCEKSSGSLNLKKDYEYLYLVPLERQDYGAILYEDPNFKGKAQIFIPKTYGPDKEFLPTEHKINLGDTSSLFAFRLNPYPDSDWKVTLYAEQNFNIGLPADTPYAEYPKGEGDWIRSLGITGLYTVTGDLQGKNPESIKIKGDLIAILSKTKTTADQPGEYAVLMSSQDDDLLDNDLIIEWGWCWDWENRRIRCPNSKAQHLLIIAYSVY